MFFTLVEGCFLAFSCLSYESKTEIVIFLLLVITSDHNTVLTQYNWPLYEHIESIQYRIKVFVTYNNILTSCDTDTTLPVPTGRHFNDTEYL